MNILKIFTKERRTGNLGEDAAAKYLKKHGYRIMKRGYVASGHEIDIVAENKDTRAFVEVKTRTEGTSNILPRPASAVNKEKMRAVISAAKVYSAFSPTEKYQRFDVIEVIVSKDGRVRTINFLEDAYRADSHH